MSATRTVTLRSDLPMRGGITIPAGTALATSVEHIAGLGHGVRLSPQIGQTLSVEHPLYEGALLAVPVCYIDRYEEVLHEALALTRRW